jgi:hypothetical protein
MRAGRIQPVGQGQPSPCNPAHHRPDRDAQDLGNFLVGQAIDTDERQDRPLLLRQVAQFAVDIVQGDPRLSPADAIVAASIGAWVRLRADLRSSAQVFWMMR